MATFFKGVGSDTYWAKTDATRTGFSPRNSGIEPDYRAVIDHIRGNTVGPFISLTRSYEVARDYALYFSISNPGVSNPAYVYELEIPDNNLPENLTLVDPIQLIGKTLPSPTQQFSYQHNGGQDVILGLANQRRFGHILKRNVIEKNGYSSSPPNISQEIRCLVASIRDSEILACGQIYTRFVSSKLPITP